MASKSDARAISETLAATTAEVATLTQLWPAVKISNHDAANALYVSMPKADGLTPVVPVAGSETTFTNVVLPGHSEVIVCPWTATGTLPIGVVGNGGTYTVEGVN